MTQWQSGSYYFLLFCHILCCGYFLPNLCPLNYITMAFFDFQHLSLFYSTFNLKFLNKLLTLFLWKLDQKEEKTIQNYQPFQGLHSQPENSYLLSVSNINSFSFCWWKWWRKKKKWWVHMSWVSEDLLLNQYSQTWLALTPVTFFSFISYAWIFHLASRQRGYFS